jgi:signal transducing adaptor molecule
MDLIAKATDENLTSENWEYIMDVCDKVTTEDNGAKDAVATMIKRLAHRNANVQLYTLEVCWLLENHFGSQLKPILARKCTKSKLWSKGAPRACFESIHRCAPQTCQRQKHTPASQGENPRTNGRMGGHV